MDREIAPVTPGELLQEEFLTPMGLSQYRLAKEIGVSPRRINEIVKGILAITADTEATREKMQDILAKTPTNLSDGRAQTVLH